MTGLRANNFGDLIFLDHGNVTYKGTVHYFLIILDAATSFLQAYHQASLAEEQTFENLREWMDVFQCSPRSACADMAFMTPSFEKFYQLTVSR